MNQRVKWVRFSGPVLLLVALLINYLSLDGGLVRPLSGQRTSAQSKRTSFFIEVSQRRRSTAKTRRAEQIADLFRNNCARCHGADGRGDTPLGHTYQAPDFTDNEWWQKHSNVTGTKTLVSIVRRGKGGMPAFGKKLKPGEIKLLVNYVRRFRKRA